jgi:hypothetical protein
LQSFSGAGFVIGAPAFFNNFLYYHGSGGTMKSFFITNAAFTTTPAAQSTTTFGNCTTPAISANRTSNGIVWEIQPENSSENLHDYNAANLSEIYNSNQLLRDNPGGAVKWTGADRRQRQGLYRRAIRIVGLWQHVSASARPRAQRRILHQFSNGDIDGCRARVSIYYTLDGSTPAANSILFGAIARRAMLTLSPRRSKRLQRQPPTPARRLLC